MPSQRHQPRGLGLRDLYRRYDLPRTRLADCRPLTVEQVARVAAALEAGARATGTFGYPLAAPPQPPTDRDDRCSTPPITTPCVGSPVMATLRNVSRRLWWARRR
ncbi:hypothetical protein GCM10007886_01720 [Methylobacterium gregans]|nr:hypothetical protein GCM10007886_01720 [Methylobacterium gregans]